MLGSTLELGLLGGSAAFGVLGLEFWGSGSLGDVDLWTHVLLLSTGVVTALPLLWFSQAARRLPLSTMGFVQYVSPTGQLLIGVLIYAEPFDGGRAAAFSVIWLACALFSWDLARRHRG
jgi:chloramphenicol-sensitive protein RarD